ncbi:MAG: hypothetical protein DMG76_23655 [Acidobacteria bacterium]|nr:MAG: hypothetical protein DMG76_23655 [Acidobacteriota bacterium]
MLDDLLDDQPASTRSGLLRKVRSRFLRNRTLLLAKLAHELDLFCCQFGTFYGSNRLDLPKMRKSLGSAHSGMFSV